MLSAAIALGVILMNDSFADRLYKRINEDYWDSKTNLYREFWSSDKKETQPAFNWSVGVMITALNARAKHSPEAKTRLKKYLKACEVYWNPKGPVPGYDVLPNPTAIDRYYDDNAWMVLALIESYELLKEKWLLDRAKAALEYSLSGLDDKLGGGIYWRESDKASKNTCSNTPVAYACLRYYEVTKEAKYLDHAVSVTNWTIKNLRDPADLLMFDNIHLNGKVDKAKYSYNAALTARCLFELEKLKLAEPRRAEMMLSSAEKKWMIHEKGMDDTGRFAHLLIEAYIHVMPRKGQFLELATALENNQRDMRFTGMWNERPRPSHKRFELIDQASVLRFLEYSVRGR